MRVAISKTKIMKMKFQFKWRVTNSNCQQNYNVNNKMYTLKKKDFLLNLKPMIYICN